MSSIRPLALWQQRTPARHLALGRLFSFNLHRRIMDGCAFPWPRRSESDPSSKIRHLEKKNEEAILVDDRTAGSVATSLSRSGATFARKNNCNPRMNNGDIAKSVLSA
jgi:hypothetical protein